MPTHQLRFVRGTDAPRRSPVGTGNSDCSNFVLADDAQQPQRRRLAEQAIARGALMEHTQKQSRHHAQDGAEDDGRCEQELGLWCGRLFRHMRRFDDTHGRRRRQRGGHGHGSHGQLRVDSAGLGLQVALLALQLMIDLHAVRDAPQQAFQAGHFPGPHLQGGLGALQCRFQRIPLGPQHLVVVADLGGVAHHDASRIAGDQSLGLPDLIFKIRHFACRRLVRLACGREGKLQSGQTLLLRVLLVDAVALEVLTFGRELGIEHLDRRFVLCDHGAQIRHGPAQGQQLIDLSAVLLEQQRSSRFGAKLLDLAADRIEFGLRPRGFVAQALIDCLASATKRSRRCSR